MKLKNWIRPALFAGAGALSGLAYYRFIGCESGGCPITANPISTMVYMGIMGWLLSMVFVGGGGEKGQKCGKG